MAESNLKKAADGYGYKYTDLAQIHTYLEINNIRYYQYVERLDNDDYIYTVPIIDGEEKPARRGCRVVQATLSGKSNPAQEQGSALTYARRYSLLMAFGLATTDDDAQLLTVTESEKRNSEIKEAEKRKKVFAYIGKRKKEYAAGVCEHYGVKDLAQLTADNINDFISNIENNGGSINE